jgi:DNA-binding transcriptional LysR family regulator
VASFNHGDAIAAAALSGVGVAQTLEMLVIPELETGKLVRVLTDWNEEPVAIQLFIPQDRVKRPAVRAVAQFLRDRIDWGGSPVSLDG